MSSAPAKAETPRANGPRGRWSAAEESIVIGTCVVPVGAGEDRHMAPRPDLDTRLEIAHYGGPAHGKRKEDLMRTLGNLLSRPLLATPLMVLAGTRGDDRRDPVDDEEVTESTAAAT